MTEATEMNLNEWILTTVLAEAAAQGLDMKELARRSGMPYDTWRNYYSKKKRTLNTDRIVQLAQGLGMTDDQLMALVFERRKRNDDLASK